MTNGDNCSCATNKQRAARHKNDKPLTSSHPFPAVSCPFAKGAILSMSGKSAQAPHFRIDAFKHFPADEYKDEHGDDDDAD